MAFPTILIGLALVLIGLQGYFDFGEVLGVEKRQPTALIPAAVGAILTLCGLVALNDGARKHAMHLAALVGVLGLAGALFRPIQKAMAGELDISAPATRLTLAMAALCLLLVILCVRSFVTARSARAGR